MARRKKKSGFDELVDVVSLFPWWVGVAGALVTYLILHAIAIQELAKPVGNAELGAYAGKQLWITLASFGQYIFPVAFLFGAAVSALNRKRDKTLHQNVKQSGKNSALLNMSWQQFEHLVAEAYRQKGYKVRKTAGGPDGGVDLELEKAGEMFLVQCKQWRATKVGVQVVRELYGVIAAKGALGGMVVTAGEFSDEARAFAKGRNIELLNGTALVGLIGANPIEPIELGVGSVQACPKCGQPMVRRTAQQGKYVGQAFWGCSQYPKCRGIRPA